jgi:HisJ family histidinol phosphate phosphatase
VTEDPRIAALPDIHGHAKGEHKPFAEERPIPYTARMLFLWFYHACRRGSPRFLMVADHMNYLTFEDPAAVNLVRRALKLAAAGDLYGAAETAGVELGHAQVVSEGLRKGMRYSIGAEVDNDPRSRPDAQNIVDAMRPDGMVRSVHFLPITHPQHGENWMWPFDNPEFKEFYDVVGTENVWELYIATLLDAIDKLPGHIVGHFYVPAKFGHWPDDAKLAQYEDRLLDACAERGMAVEINSRYIYKYFVDDEEQLAKYRAANLRLLTKAKAKGVMVAVGSDAHSPKDQGAAFETILAWLDEADINEIAFPINGRLARVALRATEELLRQQAAAAAPPPLPPLPQRVEVAPADEQPARVAAAVAVRPAKKKAPAAANGSARAGDAVAAAPKRAAKIAPAASAPAAKLPLPKTAAPAKTAPKAAAKAPAKAAKLVPSAAKAAKLVPPAAKPAAKKSTAKPAARTAAAKKAPSKRTAAAKKVAAKKVTAKRSVAKKPLKKGAPAKKVAVRSKTTAPARKAGPLKKAAKKTASRKPAKRALAPKRPAPKKRAAAKGQAKKKPAGSRR